MLSKFELYIARRAAALTLEVILVECGVANNAVWPAEPTRGMDGVDGPATVFERVHGNLSDAYDGTCGSVGA